MKPLAAGGDPGRQGRNSFLRRRWKFWGLGRFGNTPSDADQPRSQKARAIDESISASGEGQVGTAGGHLGLIFRSRMH